MRIAIIGATGTIGRAVTALLARRYEVVPVGHSGGEIRVDIASSESLATMYRRIAPIDAVVCCAGEAPFGALNRLSDDDFALGFQNKLMGQINVVRLGLPHLRDSGCFVLTGGARTQERLAGHSVIDPVNSAVEAFARAAAIELPRRIRMNVVSPAPVKESLTLLGVDPGSGLTAAETAYAYHAALEPGHNGETLDARRFVAAAA